MPVQSVVEENTSHYLQARALSLCLVPLRGTRRALEEFLTAEDLELYFGHLIDQLACSRHGQ